MRAMPLSHRTELGALAVSFLHHQGRCGESVQVFPCDRRDQDGYARLALAPCVGSARRKSSTWHL